MEKIIAKLENGSVWVEDRNDHGVLFTQYPSETNRDYNLAQAAWQPGAELKIDDKERVWFFLNNRMYNRFFQSVDLSHPVEFASKTVYWGGWNALALQRYFYFDDGQFAIRHELADPAKTWMAPQALNWQVVGDLAWAPIVTSGFKIQPYLFSLKHGIYRTENILGLFGYEGELVEGKDGPILKWSDGKEYPVDDSIKITE